MTRYIFYTGQAPSHSAMDEAKEVLLQAYDGYTVSNAMGGWLYEGRHEQEQSLRWEVLLVKPACQYPSPDFVADAIGLALKQKEVLWTKETLVGGFEQIVSET